MFCFKETAGNEDKDVIQSEQWREAGARSNQQFPFRIVVTPFVSHSLFAASLVSLVWARSCSKACPLQLVLSFFFSFWFYFHIPWWGLRQLDGILGHYYLFTYIFCIVVQERCDHQFHWKCIQLLRFDCYALHKRFVDSLSNRSLYFVYCFSFVIYYFISYCAWKWFKLFFFFAQWFI